VTTPSVTPDDGRPSAEARARLAAELHEQLASSRLAWDAALLRSDAAIAAGDQAEARAALDDHRLLLGVLQERLGEVVAAASVAREAEHVVRASAAAHPAERREVAGDPVRAAVHGSGDADPGHEHPSGQGARRGTSALLSATAALLLVTGFVNGDLLAGTGGAFAGSTTPSPTIADVQARTAGEDVVGRAGAWDDTSGPEVELPAFSGTIPPTKRPDADGGRAPSPTAAGSDTSPERDVPRAPGAEEQAPDRAPVGDRTPDGADAEEAPRLREVVERLGDLDGGDGGDADGVDAGTSLPRPLADLHELGDLAEVLEDPSTTDPASDPAGGLR
jgi:hypothetical protein